MAGVELENNKSRDDVSGWPPSKYKVSRSGGGKENRKLVGQKLEEYTGGVEERGERVNIIKNKQ